MRLYKKAAICLLAAVMTVSMMTACGGTGGGSPENPDSKPGVTDPDDKNDNKDDGDGDGDGNGEIAKDDFDNLPDLSTESGLPLVWADSYSAKLTKLLYGNSYTICMEQTSNGTTQLVKTVSLNGNIYSENTVKGKKSVTLYLDGYFYDLMESKKIALKFVGNADPGLSTVELVSTTGLVGGKLTVDGVTYYTEKMQINLKDKKGPFTQTSTYCYDDQRQLAYSFTESQGQVVKTKYLSPLLEAADPTLFKIPNGYKVYTEDLTEDGHIVIYDENGNKIDDIFSVIGPD